MSDDKYIDFDIAWYNFIEFMYTSKTYNKNIITLISVMIDNQ